MIFGIAYTFFSLQNRFTAGGTRPTLEDEQIGLEMAEMAEMAEMGVPAYDDSGLADEFISM